MTNQSATKQFLTVAGPLFLVLFIDGMGLGLVFPILNALIMDPHSAFLAASTSSNTRNLIFGFTIGIFMLCWFFGAAFLGDLSDQIGRKKSLMLCLLGAFLGYFFSAISIYLNSYWLLLVGRMIAGFTGGSQPIAQAAIVDLSSAEHKARNLGWILFAISIGFVFGPLLGGILSDHALCSCFNYSTPFIFAAVISLLNAGLLQILFRESFQRVKKLELKLHHAIEIFISAFRHEKVRELSIIFLILIFGWSSYYTFISMFLLREYHFSTLQTSFFMGALGAGFGLGTGFLVEYCTKRCSLKKVVITGALIAALFIFITVLIKQPFYAWICVIPIGMAIAVIYSVILTIFSNQVNEDSQGWVMGITGAIMAFAFGINGILTGIMANSGASIPLFIAVAGLVISAGLMLILYKEKLTNYDVALKK